MSTAPRRPDLANEPVGRLMLRLSIPTITAQLVNMLYNLVDRIYISYIPDVGTLALTGLGVCLPIILLVSAFAALCASSGAPLASIAMGQRNNEKAEGILGSCTALLLCVSAVLTVVLSCFYTPILLAFGATEDALPYAQRYIAIYSLGTVFVQLSLGLNPFITAQGFSKAGMLTVLIGAVLNTLLDPLFIFVFHMDVQGAGDGDFTGRERGVRPALPDRQADDTAPEAPSAAAELEAACAVRGAGTCAVHYAEHGEPCVRVLQHIAARGGRHAGRRHDDHLLHADAVCAAALAGAFAGRAADYLLQLRCKAPGSGESRVPDTADFVLGVLGGAGADVHLCAADFCLSADPGRGAAGVRNSMRAPIHGGRDDFRRADCVSADVCGAGECEVQPISGVPAQADSADSAGVSAAAVHSGHVVCDFPRRTDCGCARGLVHGDAVYACV